MKRAEDAKRGKDIELCFEEWCTNSNIPFEKTSKEVDMKYHIDYFIYINGTKIAVDVKNWGFNYNFDKHKKNVRMFEIEVTNIKKYLEVRNNDVAYYAKVSSWDVSKIDAYNKATNDNVADDYVAFVQDSGNVLFIRRYNAYLTDLLKRFWIEKSTNKNIYHMPCLVYHEPYVLCANQNATKICWCMFVELNDIKPYMQTFSEILAIYQEKVVSLQHDLLS